MSQDSFDLSFGVQQSVDELTRAASKLTGALAISLFIPIGFIYVIAMSLYRIRGCSQLRAQRPEIDEQTRELGRKPGRERRALAAQNADAARLLEFKQARLGFWVLLVVPFLYFGFMVTAIKLLS